MVLCDKAASCATVPLLSHGGSNNATTAITTPIPIFIRLEFRTIILFFCLKRTK
jgi:hypothetical protein